MSINTGEQEQVPLYLGDEVGQGCTLYQRQKGGSITKAIDSIADGNQELVSEAKFFVGDVFAANTYDGSDSLHRGYPIKDIQDHSNPDGLVEIIGLYGAAHYAKVLTIDAELASSTGETTKLAIDKIKEIGALPLGNLIIMDAKIVNGELINERRERVQQILDTVTAVPIENDDGGHTHIGLLW